MSCKSLQNFPNIENAFLARALTLTGSILGALAGGTNYLYSAYSPQMGAKLRLSYTQLNIIGLSGNFGGNITGPLWGHIADRCGPRILFVLAFSLLLIGYLGIKLFYDEILGLPGTEGHTLTFGLIVMTIFAFCTGAGGNAGMTGALNATAKSFPNKMRASVAGLVISGYGLSAFIFSTLAHRVFPGDTSKFLLILALGTSLPMAIGSTIVRVVPHDISASGSYVAINTEDSEEETPYSGIQRRLSSEVVGSSFPLLSSPPPSSNLTESRQSRSRSLSASSSFELPVPEFGTHVPLQGTGMIQEHIDLRDISDTSEPSDAETLRDAQLSTSKETRILDISGKALFINSNFWLLFAILSLLAGTGIMWINNVGSVIQALVAEGRPNDWDRELAVKLQADHVSIISVTNCLGRVAIGLTADFFKHHLSVRRVSWLIPISFLFILSQYFALNATSAETPLKLASITLGFAYGATYSLVPIVTSEWFGLPRFSQNWGCVVVGPLFGSNLFGLAFGMILDAHVNPKDAATSTTLQSRTFMRRDGSIGKERLCFDGPPCYADSFKLTIAACTVAALLSILALWRDRRMRLRQDSDISAP